MTSKIILLVNHNNNSCVGIGQKSEKKYGVRLVEIPVYNWASEESPTLTSTIEIDIPARADIYICPKKMRGTLLRASAMYCVGRKLWIPHSQTPYLKVAFG